VPVIRSWFIEACRSTEYSDAVVDLLEAGVMEAHVRLAQRGDVSVLVALMTEFYREAAYSLSPEPASRAFEAVLFQESGQVLLSQAFGPAIHER
jgi:hypothetical protein